MHVLCDVQVVSRLDGPLQHDYKACGIFLIMAAVYTAIGRALTYSHANVAEWRLRVAATILNTE